MKGPGKLWITVFVLGVAGLALFIVLLIRHGLGDVGAAFAKAGWGIVAVVAFHLVVLVCNGLAWHYLFPPEKRLPFATLLFIRWIGESVQNLFPATAVGGEVVRARLAATRGVPGSLCAATVIADITLGMFAQALFTMSGVFLLVRFTGHGGIATQVIVGTLLAIAMMGGFYLVQHYGLFRLVSGLVRRISSADAWRALSEHGEALDSEVRDAYARRRGAWMSFFWSCMNWVTGVGEVWIALMAMGITSNIGKAWIVESIQQAVSASVFLVPGRLGVQEGCYLILGKVLGFPPDIALSLALIRRVRELAFGIPGLVAWQFAEGRHLFRRRESNVEVGQRA
jgi:putative membrane protein